MDPSQPPSPLEPGAPKPRPRAIYLLPNLFTTGGMFAGFYAIISAAGGHYTTAAMAVFVAAVLDGVDGRVARMTGTASDFGVQYDSLADLVSFGMAPALVMYHWSLSTFAQDGTSWGKFGWAVAFLYAACGALRLARFNTQVGTQDKRWFVGLASPAAAGLMMAFVWTFAGEAGSGRDMRGIAAALTVLAGLAMVSRVRYFSFKAFPDNGRVRFSALLLGVGLLVGVAIDPPRVLLAIGLTYVVSGPIAWFWLRRRRGATPEA